LIQAPIDRIGVDITKMQAFMVKASAIVLRGFEVRAECGDRPDRKSAVVRYPNRFYDESGIEFFDKLMGLLRQGTN
jgi:hypothetical protein